MIPTTYPPFLWHDRLSCQNEVVSDFGGSGDIKSSGVNVPALAKLLTCLLVNDSTVFCLRRINHSVAIDSARWIRGIAYWS